MWIHFTKQKKKQKCLSGKGALNYIYIRGAFRTICGPGKIIPTVKIKYKWHNIKIIELGFFSIAYGLDEQINKWNHWIKRFISF